MNRRFFLCFVVKYTVRHVSADLYYKTSSNWLVTMTLPVLFPYRDRGGGMATNGGAKEGKPQVVGWD